MTPDAIIARLVEIEDKIQDALDRAERVRTVKGYPEAFGTATALTQSLAFDVRALRRVIQLREPVPA